MKLLKTLILSLSFFPLTVSANDWTQARLSLEKTQQITVYRSANCSCCHKWIEHLQQHQFDVIDQISENMTDIKQQLGIPVQMASCHTAVVGNYLIEGHVPADDIKRLILDQPTEIKGLSVPQMPVGTPGMEMGPRKDDFAVLSFDVMHQYQIYRAYQTNTDNQYQVAPASTD